MESKVRTTLKIGERSYSLKISQEDTELVMKAAELLNEKFHEFKLQFKSSDAQDHLAMSALFTVTEQLKKTSPEESDMNELLSKVEEANQELMKVMKG
ncbi:MAG TPA: cell division protein ZapA [Bacteroidetes bacterium]|nr:cell division protein ZapA [Bacteroidota bacterium]